jgi:arylformamidase
VSDLEREYSPSSRVGGTAEPFVADYVARSAVVAAALGDRVERRPGGTLLVRAAPGEGPSPLLVFVHGGYWQALSAATSLQPAAGALAEGWSYAAVEYTIAPAGDLPCMVAECAAALADLASCGPWREVVVAGHSAGAHLVAMVAVNAVPPLTVDRLVLLSGIYDLRPLVHTSVNEPLGLDEMSAAALSPALLPLVPMPVESMPSTMVAWGDNDTDAFRRQGREFAARLGATPATVSAAEVVGRHHFDIVDDLVDRASAVGAFALGPRAEGGVR